jgi:type VI secretion system protein ImpJ
MDVHWHEGLFLQPQHMQRLQRTIYDLATLERKAGWPFPYGLTEAHLSEDDLENFRVRFQKLHAIMPSGTVLRFPENADLPSIDIKAALESRQQAVVLLGLPVWSEERANTVDPELVVDPRAKILYRVVEKQIPDENGGDNPQPFYFRRLNARLLLEGEDTSDLETIRLVRIARAVGEEGGRARRDPHYVGPCLTLGGSVTLLNLVRDLSNMVLATRQELAVQLSRGGFAIETLRGIQLEQLFRLRTLNHYAAKLETLIEVPAYSPFDFYLELKTLLGELAALRPEQELWQIAPFNHDAPYPCFEELTVRLRQLLQGTVAPSFRRVLFTGEPRALRADFTEEDFRDTHECFLAIRSREDPRDLARLVEDPDRFKLMPESRAHQAIRGATLVEERFPPFELPVQADRYYFRVIRGEGARSWQQIQAEKAAVILWPQSARDDYECTLFLTTVDSKAKP